MEDKSVRVLPVDDHPGALWLQWDQKVNAEDVPSAFQGLTAALDAAASPVNVLVDLRKNPGIPLTVTIHETIFGPSSHPQMGQWLVIGMNRRAEMIANVITKGGIRRNIHWFETEEEALTYLTEVEDANADPSQEAVA